MFVKTLVATLCVIGVALAEQSPVFLWGVNGPAKPSLQLVTKTDFQDLISSYAKDHMVVTFLENGLSSNDFFCANIETSQSCYAHLQGIESKVYYAAVEDPVEAIRSSTEQREYNSVNTKGQLANPLECSVGKNVIVTFDEKPEDARGERLEAHDAAIYHIGKANKCPTVYLYMAAPSSSPAKRSKRETKAAFAENGKIFRESNKFLLYYTTLQILDNNEVKELTLADMKVKVNDANNFTVTFDAEGKMFEFDIYNRGDGYYYMSDVSFNDTMFRVMDVNAPTTFSYHCGALLAKCIVRPTKFCTAQLLWKDLQFQAPFNDKKTEEFVFDDSWDCVPFFTPGILMGLFVLIFLLVITFVGICWMVDINTMDRFDDPKGKTITINVSE